MSQAFLSIVPAGSQKNRSQAQEIQKKMQEIINKFPVELWHHIFSFLEAKEYVALARTAKFFNQCMQDNKFNNKIIEKKKEIYLTKHKSQDIKIIQQHLEAPDLLGDCNSGTGCTLMRAAIFVGVFIGAGIGAYELFLKELPTGWQVVMFMAIFCLACMACVSPDLLRYCIQKIDYNCRETQKTRAHYRLSLYENQTNDIEKQLPHRGGKASKIEPPQTQEGPSSPNERRRLLN